MRKQTSKLILAFGIMVLSLILCVSVVAAEEKLAGKTVNINTGTAEELAEVPLITPELAEAIVTYREEAGDFVMIEELLLIDGFDRKLLHKVKDFLLLEGIGGEDCTC
jgi:competence ComEA-like helix-hairpin-helix protein